MQQDKSKSTYRRRRIIFVFLFALMIAGFNIGSVYSPDKSEIKIKNSVPVADIKSESAIKALEKIPVKGRAPKTGYTRTQFTNGWNDASGCDTRNIILSRDLEKVEYIKDSCDVLSGVLVDPYTGGTIQFHRGPGTSQDVQIDHVVALSDAWQKGAQNLSYRYRNNLANDPLNLLAVDGEANQKKSDADAASWLPPFKPYRCAYVARQEAVKTKYNLWMTLAEKEAIKRILSKCPSQPLPVNE